MAKMTEASPSSCLRFVASFLFALFVTSGPGMGCLLAEEPPIRSSSGAEGEVLLTPVMASHIGPGKTVVWCVTFQVAWKALLEQRGILEQTSGGEGALPSVLQRRGRDDPLRLRRRSRGRGVRRPGQSAPGIRLRAADRRDPGYDSPGLRGRGR